jgi:hypothetical protein
MTASYGREIGLLKRFVSYRYVCFLHMGHWSATDISVFYSGRVKLQVVQYAENHGKRPAGRKFDVNKYCVREWCKQKKKARKFSGK